MITRQQFYRSSDWLNFRSLIIAQRTDPDGFVHCADCGKPILHKYDLILHHKQELSEANMSQAFMGGTKYKTLRLGSIERLRWLV